MIMDERTWRSTLIWNRNKTINLSNEVFTLTIKRCIILFVLRFHYYDRTMNILDALLRKHSKDFTIGLSCCIYLVRKIICKNRHEENECVSVLKWARKQTIKVFLSLYQVSDNSLHGIRKVIKIKKFLSGKKYKT